MAELGPDAQALVRAGRGALKPSAADRERVARALHSRIGSSATASNGGSTVAASHGLRAKLFAVVGTGAVVGAALIAWSVSTRRAEVTPPAVAVPLVVPAAPVVVPNIEPAPVVSATPPTPVEALPVEPRAVATRRASGRLAEEVAILSRAEKELHAGRPSSALAVLEEHRQKFPNGELAQERIAARVHALCALGRVADAEAALARLRRVSPGSPQEGRAREACAPGAQR